MTLYATFDSRCGWCQGEIAEGEPIAKLDDEWVHESCALEGDEENDDGFEVVLDDAL